MAEYIKREDVNDLIYDGWWSEIFGERTRCGELCITYLDALPGVEIICCRDCKHRFESMEMKTTDGTVVELGHYCKATGRFVGDDEFCSWAERKEKDE